MFSTPRTTRRQSLLYTRPLMAITSLLRKIAIIIAPRPCSTHTGRPLINLHREHAVHHQPPLQQVLTPSMHIPSLGPAAPNHACKFDASPCSAALGSSPSLSKPNATSICPMNSNHHRYCDHHCVHFNALACANTPSESCSKSHGSGTLLHTHSLYIDCTLLHVWNV